MEYSAGGKPWKSWMVRGCACAVIALPRMYQCADTDRIARGRGNSRPSRTHAAVYRLGSIACMGVP